MEIDRADSASAEMVATTLCPDPTARTIWAALVHHAIDVAARTAPDSWAITLFKDLIRLNVGQVAVQELWPRKVAIYCLAPVPSLRTPGVRRDEQWSGYRAVAAPAERWRVDLRALEHLDERLLRQHHEFVRLAALAKKGSPFRRSHSEGVVKYLQALALRGRSDAHLLPEESVGPTFPEGGLRRITVNAYERSDAARRACIQHYGARCAVCGMSFGDVYGPQAEGHIHVHHVRALADIGVNYDVDPIADLRPVCANCHSVIHLGGETRSIEAMRKLLNHKAG